MFEAIVRFTKLSLNKIGIVSIPYAAVYQAFNSYQER